MSLRYLSPPVLDNFEFHFSIFISKMAALLGADSSKSAPPNRFSTSPKTHTRANCFPPSPNSLAPEPFLTFVGLFSFPAFNLQLSTINFFVAALEFAH